MGKLNWRLAVVGVLLSLSTQGQTFEWAKSIGGASNDEANGVIVDGSGFVHVAGNFLQASPGLNFNPGGTTSITLTSGATRTGTFIGKYSANGLNMPQGFSVSNGTSDFRNNTVVRDASNNIYMAGIGGNNARLNKGSFFEEPFINLSSGRGYIAKFNSDYDASWAIGIGPASITNGLEVFDLAVDGSGNVYAVGQFQGTTDFGVSSENTAGTNNCTAVPTSLTASGLDAFVVKYNSQGCIQWAFKLGGTSSDVAYGIDVDNSGNIYVGGVYRGLSVNLNPLGTAISVSEFGGVAGSGDAFLAKYNTNGICQWAFSLGVGLLDQINSVSVDPSSGDVYVAGMSTNDLNPIDFDPSGSTASFAGSGLKDAFIAKYSTSGAYQWHVGIGSTADDEASSIFYHTNGIYLTGSFSGTSTSFGSSQSANAAGGVDAFFAKYTSAGVCDFVGRMGGASNERGKSISAASDGKFYIVGSYDGNGDFDATAGTTTLTNAGGRDVFMAGYSSPACAQPSIITQPAASTICSGNSTSFTVAATTVSGTLGYQWKKGGVNVSGATLATYTIPSAVSGDAGSYTCEITNGCSAAILSNAATLTVNSPVNITTQPAASSVCVGGNASLSVAATGSGTLSYQWKRGTTNVGTNASTISINPAALIDAGSYSVEVTGTCGTVTSSAAVLTVNSPVTITTQPAASSVCVGGNASLSVVATGSGTLSYQWKRGTTNVGTNASTISINPAALIDGGSYTVEVTGTCGTVTSSAAGLTVNSPVTISTQPAASSVCVGGSASLSVAATGSGTLSYQWKRGTTNVGTNASAISINPTALIDAGSYTVEVTGTCGTVTSSAAVLTVNSPVTISTQPAASSVCVGGNASLSVAATGSGTLSYQWKRGTTNVGTNASTISVTPAALIDAGSYTVEVTGTCGTVTSSAAVLTVNSPVTISTQPAASSVCVGGNASLSVVATGSGTLSYQWKRGTTNLGTNASTISINPAALIDAGSYTVEVTGSCGTVTSSAAVLTVNSPVTVTTQPSATAACVGGNASLSVAATGSGTLSYQWKRGTTNVGTNASTISINPAALIDAGSYTVEVTGTCGTVTSSAAVLTVNSPVTITTQPAASSVCVGGNASLSVAAAGSGTLSYQWKRGTTNVGTNASTISVTPAALIDGGSYTVEVTGTCGTVTSSAAVLTVNSPVTISTQPAASSVCVGGNASLSVAATGSGTLSYQWKRGTTNVGTNASTISINPAALIDAGSYTVEVTGTCGTVTSSAAVLTVNSPVTISTQPAASSVCVGGNASLSVVATGSGTLSYQWKRGTTNVGTNASTIFINPAALIDAGSYTVEVTGTCGTVTSSAAVLTINQAPQITIDPVNGNYCAGTSVNLAVTATGATPLSYQWKKDGDDVAGANASVYSIPSLSVASAGSYAVFVSNACGNALSNAAAIGLLASPAIVTGPANASVCSSGQSASLSVLASGIGLSYQWKKGSTSLVEGGAYSGVTSSTLTINVTGAEEGTYSVVVNGTCSPSVESAVVSVSISSIATVINTQPTASTVCTAQTATFSVSATGPSLTYQWKKGGVPMSNSGTVSGVQTSVLSINSVSGADADNYVCDISSSCAATVSSSAAALSILAPVSINTQPSSETWCTGVANGLTVSASGGGTVNYQWSKNGSNISDGTGISGTNAATILFSAPTSGNAGNYVVTVSNSCNSISSSTAVVSIGAAPTIVSQPTSVNACASGTLVVFAVSVSGTGLSYQWKKEGVNLSNGGNVSGVLTNTLTITAASAANEGNYTVEVSSACGSNLISNSASFAIDNTAPNISTQPFSQAVCSGSGFSLSIIASGNGLSYQWSKGGVALSNTGSVSGSTSATLSVSSATSLDAGSYTVAIASTCSAAITSSAAVVQVNNCTNTISAGSTVFALYPNPALERFTLQSTAPVNQVFLISANGDIHLLNLLNQGSGESQWDISSLPSGIYEVKATVQEEVFISRLAIIK